MAGHQPHHAIEIVSRGHGNQAVRHDVLHWHRRHWLAILRKRMNDIAFGDYNASSPATAPQAESAGLKNSAAIFATTEIPPHGATWEFPEFAKYSTDPNGAARNTAQTER